MGGKQVRQRRVEQVTRFIRNIAGYPEPIALGLLRPFKTWQQLPGLFRNDELARVLEEEAFPSQIVAKQRNVASFSLQALPVR
ncbi:hypothetical protein GCM10011385_17530 [Nitratireductor aestuarii]|uniref:Uncharacterized protein n=1 Tax=Nitratireductor aestuarii TaxID=1735103 RepID=A0A916RNT9_9HYPH|nr:hypothetical protein GCM10011385_17530 [Nitratireductor aestuarii]